MYYIVIPAVLALIAKLAVLLVSSKHKPESNLFIPLILLFAVINLCEILGLWEFLHGLEGLMMLKAYYALTIAGWCVIYLYVVDITGLNFRKVKMLVISSSVLLAAVTIGTNGVVAGVDVLNYSMTVSRGNLYVLWQAFCLTAVAATCGSLWIGYKKAKEHLMEIRCVYTAMALAPIILVSLFLLVVMSLGYQINAVVFMPVATSLFLVIMLASEYQHRLTDIRRFLPASDERKTSSKIMEIFSSYSRDDIEYRQAVSEIERLLVLHKYDKNKGNASETAGKMGMPRSSLYSIFNRLEIESRGDQKSS